MNLIKNVIGKNIVVSGIGAGGEPIKSVTMNANGTFTIVDTEDVSHTATPTYTNGVLTALTYDGQSIALSYDTDGNLTKVGSVDVDGTENYVGVGIQPLDYTATFRLPKGTSPETYDDYEKVTVNSGTTLTAPTNPTVESGKFFNGWSVNGSAITFPYSINDDINIDAMVNSVHTEYEVDSADTQVGYVSGGTLKYYKRNNGKAFVAWTPNNSGVNYKVLMIISNISYNNANMYDAYNRSKPITFSYLGETWYCYYDIANGITPYGNYASNYANAGTCTSASPTTENFENAVKSYLGTT